MHLSHVPLHVSRRKGHFETCSHALLVDRINVLHPNRHPHTLVSFFVSILLEGCRVRASAAAALRSLTKKYFEFAGTNGTKFWWRSPIPTLPPAQLLKPPKAGFDVG